MGEGERRRSRCVRSVFRSVIFGGKPSKGILRHPTGSDPIGTVCPPFKLRMDMVAPDGGGPKPLPSPQPASIATPPKSYIHFKTC